MKAASDAPINAVRPSPDAVAQTTRPLVLPSTAATPAMRPLRNAWSTITENAGPGVVAMAVHVRTNASDTTTNSIASGCRTHTCQLRASGLSHNDTTRGV